MLGLLFRLDQHHALDALGRTDEGADLCIVNGVAGSGQRVGVLGCEVGFVEGRLSSRRVSNRPVVVLLLEFSRRFLVCLGFGLLCCQSFNHRDEFDFDAVFV